MGKYIVEMRDRNNEYFQNWIGDYVVAENADVAIEFAKWWLLENGYDGDIDGIEFLVRFYGKE